MAPINWELLANMLPNRIAKLVNRLWTGNATRETSGRQGSGTSGMKAPGVMRSHRRVRGADNESMVSGRAMSRSPWRHALSMANSTVEGDRVINMHSTQVSTSVRPATIRISPPEEDSVSNIQDTTEGCAGEQLVHRDELPVANKIISSTPVTAMPLSRPSIHPRRKTFNLETPDNPRPTTSRNAIESSLSSSLRHIKPSKRIFSDTKATNDGPSTSEPQEIPAKRPKKPIASSPVCNTPKVEIAVPPMFSISSESAALGDSDGQKRRRIPLVTPKRSGPIDLPPAPEVGYTVTTEDLDEQRKCGISMTQRELQESAPQTSSLPARVSDAPQKSSPVKFKKTIPFPGQPSSGTQVVEQTAKSINSTASIASTPAPAIPPALTSEPACNTTQVSSFKPIFGPTSTATAGAFSVASSISTTAAAPPMSSAGPPKATETFAMGTTGPNFVHPLAPYTSNFGTTFTMSTPRLTSGNPISSSGSSLAALTQVDSSLRDSVFYSASTPSSSQFRIPTSSTAESPAGMYVTTHTTAFGTPASEEFRRNLPVEPLASLPVSNVQNPAFAHTTAFGTPASEEFRRNLPVEPLTSLPVSNVQNPAFGATFSIGSSPRTQGARQRHQGRKHPRKK